MKIDLFGIFSFRPFWEKQYGEDDYIGAKLTLGIIGYVSGIWILPNLLTLNFGLQFLDVLNAETGFLSVWSSLWVQFLMSLIASVIAIYLIDRYSEVYSGYETKENIQIMLYELKESLIETDQSYRGLKLVIIFLFPILLGFLTGILYSLILSVVHFIFFFVLVFFLGNFFSVGSGLIIMSTLTSWIVTGYFAIERKLELHESPDQEQENRPLISKRNIDIIKSEEEPIICPACRSFIPATSDTCSVCGEDLDRD